MKLNRGLLYTTQNSNFIHTLRMNKSINRSLSTFCQKELTRLCFIGGRSAPSELLGFKGSEQNDRPNLFFSNTSPSFGNSLASVKKKGFHTSEKQDSPKNDFTPYKSSTDNRDRRSRNGSSDSSSSNGGSGGWGPFAKAKDFFKKYGITGIIVYSILHIIPVSALFLAIRNQWINANEILNKLKEFFSFSSSKASQTENNNQAVTTSEEIKEEDNKNEKEDGKTSFWTSIILALALNEFIEPIRIPMTILLTPYIVKLLRKMKR